MNTISRKGFGIFHIQYKFANLKKCSLTASRIDFYYTNTGGVIFVFILLYLKKYPPFLIAMLVNFHFATEHSMHPNRIPNNNGHSDNCNN